MHFMNRSCITMTKEFFEAVKADVPFTEFSKDVVVSDEVGKGWNEPAL